MRDFYILTYWAGGRRWKENPNWWIRYFGHFQFDRFRMQNGPPLCKEESPADDAGALPYHRLVVEQDVQQDKLCQPALNIYK